LRDEEDSANEQNKYFYLADKEEFSAEKFDFNDPASLMRRQKAILQAIQKHEAIETFNPLYILSKAKPMWTLILFHGGKFVL